MDDLISRKAAIDAVREAYENEEMFDGYEYRLNELPCEEPRMKGKWVDLKCDQCGQVDTTKPNFCPNCGADMRGESDG